MFSLNENIFHFTILGVTTSLPPCFNGIGYFIYLQKSLNLTEEFGIFLRVVGGLDIVNGRASWEFQSIDPSTGNSIK